MPGLGGAWRSLVAHLLWEQGVGGSNPLAPIAKLARPLREPCGCSSTVEPQPSKLVMGVRFPSPALEEGPFTPSYLLSFCGRNHSETWAGCIVRSTTVTRSSLRASRFVSRLRVAEKASRVFLAS